eukprot:Seg1804.2 transcript_id=Seg1804.2/GoldUCD/mRNA.D3Y31 product="Neuronal acetylcholine receptor subunit alpha-7" protein_id=Seg1804.2/GoldUCD/D3Y31
MSWNHAKMKWNTSEYGSITELRVNPDRLWVPDVFLINNAKGSFEVQGAKAKVVLRFDGHIIWANPALFKSSCEINVRYFPFDDQTCHLKFGSMTYNISSNIIQPEQNSIDAVRYVKNGEWELFRTKVEHFNEQSGSESFSVVRYSITVRRITLYYVMNFILPCVLIAVLTVLVFLLPPESGERVSYGITVILSFTILLLMLYEKLPVTSSEYPLIAVYYACTTFQVSIALACCVWVLRFYHHDPPTDELPRWVKVVVLNWLARIVLLKKSTDQVRQELILHSWEELAHFKPKRTKNALTVVMNSIFKKEEESAKREEWRIVATILNRLCLWIFIATGIIVFIAVFLGSPRARNLEL